MASLPSFLLVDDDHELRHALAQQLQVVWPGACTTEAPGELALARALAGEPADLVVAEIHTAWTDGFEILRAVKERWPGCSLVFHTGRGSEELAARALEAGADGYVVKGPRSIELVVGASRAALARAREARRRQEGLEALGRVSDLAHGLNNQLTGILGNAEILLADLGSSDRLHGQVHQILQAGKRAAELTAQLLAVGRCARAGDRRTLEAGTAGTEVVLLVEDEGPLRSLVQFALESRGYRVLCAGDAEQALHLCRGYPGEIQLCLSDVVLRGQSGRELVAQVVQLRPHIRALFMSGYPREALALQGGFEGFEILTKPFGIEELLERVRGVLAR